MSGPDCPGDSPAPTASVDPGQVSFVPDVHVGHVSLTRLRCSGSWLVAPVGVRGDTRRQARTPGKVEGLKEDPAWQRRSRTRLQAGGRGSNEVFETSPPSSGREPGGRAQAEPDGCSMRKPDLRRLEESSSRLDVACSPPASTSTCLRSERQTEAKTSWM